LKLLIFVLNLRFWNQNYWFLLNLHFFRILTLSYYILCVKFAFLKPKLLIFVLNLHFLEFWTLKLLNFCIRTAFLCQNSLNFTISNLSVHAAFKPKCSVFFLSSLALFAFLLWPFSGPTRRRRKPQVINYLFFRFSYLNVIFLACLTFGCIISMGQLNDILMFKMTMGWINISLSCLFVYLYYRHGRGLTIKREKKVRFLLSN
jgi:hypothetical protein